MAKAPALERGLMVMEALAEDPYEMGLQELVDALNIPMASLWRIMKVLEARGYVIFDRKRHTYRLGFRFMYMGSIVLGGSHFRSNARVYLRRLSEATGETSELDVRIRDQLVLMDQVTGPNAVYLYSHPGSAMPYFHATAPGKVYLAHMNAEKMRLVLARLGLARLTPKTIQSMEDLEKELERVRASGFAVDVEEMREGVARVAAPVFDGDGRVSACIALACPAFRIREEGREETYGAWVKRIAAEMSLGEGGRL
ncbi:MAG: IclR family transcriptional regulator [Deltaproteobacteria bacterium]|nr:IclR family transcriptional regulator [Deltaproteobacteria bacterium]MBW2346265.1 IclR family transcriptional regulator [Deltaproteobacteria bacterium]